MTALKSRISLLALFVCGTLSAQQPPATTAKPSFDADACLRHCKEMASARQKMMDEHKAAMDKRDAAWKEIKAQVDAAKSLKGDKKVAALESAFEKLLAFHESMQHSMEMGMGSGMGMGMACCAGGEMEHGMMGGMDHHMSGMQDCPMMKGEKPAQPDK